MWVVGGVVVVKICFGILIIGGLVYLSVFDWICLSFNGFWGVWGFVVVDGVDIMEIEKGLYCGGRVG